MRNGGDSFRDRAAFSGRDTHKHGLYRHPLNRITCGAVRCHGVARRTREDGCAYREHGWKTGSENPNFRIFGSSTFENQATHRKLLIKMHQRYQNAGNCIGFHYVSTVVQCVRLCWSSEAGGVCVTCWTSCTTNGRFPGVIVNRTQLRMKICFDIQTAMGAVRVAIPSDPEKQICAAVQTPLKFGSFQRSQGHILPSLCG